MTSDGNAMRKLVNKPAMVLFLGASVLMILLLEGRYLRPSESAHRANFGVWENACNQRDGNDTTKSRIMPSGGKAYALLVGIAKYNLPKSWDLKYPPQEVDSLAKILTAAGYIVETMSDSLATREKVLSRLHKLARGRDSNDRLLFYFTGHGMKFKRARGEMNTTHFKKFFDSEINTYNEARSRGDSVDYLILALYQHKRGSFEDVIGAHEIADSLNRSPAHQRILVIDACYGGALVHHYYLPIGAYSPRLINDGFFAITSGKEKVGDGLHSQFLFAGLHGAADTTCAGNRDGYVSAYELAVFMDDVLRYYYKNKSGLAYKIRYVHIGAGEILLTNYPLQKGTR